MPHYKFRLLVPALLTLSGCASPNFFSGLASKNKDATTPAGQAAGPANPAGDRGSQSAWTAQAGAPDGRSNAWSNPYANRSPAELLADSEQSRRAGNLTSARLACEQAIRLTPFDLDAKYQMARISDDEGRYADAERIYINILNEKPGDTAVLTSLGWSYYLQGRYDESERCLRDVLAQQPQNQVALNDLGFVYGARGNLDEAWRCFRAAGTEAQAQDAMAMLAQNNRPNPGPGDRNETASYRDSQADSPAQANTSVKTADARTAAKVPEQQFTTPQAKKLAEDFQRLKAEHDKQEQQRRARQDSQKISAPSPWNNDRQGGARPRDAGNDQRPGAQDRPVPYGYGAQGANPGSPRQNYGSAGQPLNGQNDAAFPGATPSQANRPGTAEPGAHDLELPATGNFAPNNYDPATQPGFAPGPAQGPRMGQGSQAVFEPPQGRSERPQLPIITPGPARDDSANVNPSYNQSLNSLPQDNSFAPLPSSGAVTAEYRVPEWAAGPGARGQADRPNLQNQIQTTAGQQPNPAAGRSRNPWQDAQAAAAQVGLSAGPGSMGIPPGDWPAQPNGQPTAQPGPGNGAPQNLNRQPGTPPAGSYWAQSPNGSAVPAQQPQSQQSQSQQFPSNQLPISGQNPGAGAGQTNLGGNVSQMPGRPLAYPTIAPAVVPSAQGRVYGAGDDSPLGGSYPRGSLPPTAGRQ